MECGVMKKMQGMVDPISLGFILTAIIAGAGITTTSNTIEGSDITKVSTTVNTEVSTKVNTESQKNITVKNPIESTQQQHLIYSDTTK